MWGVAMNEQLKKPSLAERKEALIAQCSAQRTQMGREVEVMRAPSALTGGGVARHLSGAKAPLALATLVLGLVATRSKKYGPMIATGLSVFKLAQGGLAILRNRAAQ